jgi:hypothetical protein
LSKCQRPAGSRRRTRSPTIRIVASRRRAANLARICRNIAFGLLQGLLAGDEKSKSGDFLRSGESWKEKRQAFLHKFSGKLGVSEMGFRFLTCKWVLSEGFLRETEKTQMRERERERERERGWLRGEDSKTQRQVERKNKTEKRELRDKHFFGIKKKIIKSKKIYFNDIGKI